MKSFVLKLTSAVAIDGQISKAGSLVEVSEAEAKNLLHRGKAVLATAEDGVEQTAPVSDHQEIELSKLNKAELLNFAKENEIAVADGMTKAQLIEAIESAPAGDDSDKKEDE